MPVTQLPVDVSAANLPLLRQRLKVPDYDRGGLQSAVVHIGVGGFNRAHQAVYLDDLLGSADTRESAVRWAECGIGLLPPDRRMRDVLAAQDHLYVMVERSATGRKARIVGSICNYVYAPEMPEAAIARMVSPECRIVSMTVTEGGYFVDQGTGAFEENHPGVRHDLRYPDAPRTFLGYLCEALDRRRTAGLPPFTVMSCDNLQGNGHTTAQVVCAFAGMRNPALRRWIEENVAFPNSMVDRIVPATTEVERKLIEERFGVRDGWPVFTEPFRQWVIEDRFCNGRPPWERVGALMTDEVGDFEMMKMRLLNGSHFALAYFGAMLRFEFVHDMLADQLLRRFVAAYMQAVCPAVPDVRGVDLEEYQSTLLDRFSNPNIRDQISRICAEGSVKLPRFILPPMLELSENGKDTRLLSLVVASWIFYLKGRDVTGKPLAVVDANADELMGSAQSLGTDPRPILAVRSVFGERLPANGQLVGQIEAALVSFAEIGVAETLGKFLS